MAKQYAIYEPTRCGICDAHVVLIQGQGSHALAEIDARGLKVVHMCPESRIRYWNRMMGLARLCSDVARENPTNG